MWRNAGITSVGRIGIDHWGAERLVFTIMAVRVFPLILIFSTLAAVAASGQGNGVVINEIHYHPPHADTVAEPTNWEWIELRNTGDVGIATTGWRITKGVTFDFPDTVIAPGGSLVVAADTTDFAAAYPAVVNVVGGWTGSLSNSGEKITVERADGTVVDSVHYYDEGDWAALATQADLGLDWATPADGGGRTLELVNPLADNDVGQNWKPSAVDGGTPGAVNAAHDPAAPPFVLDVTHAPAVPRSDQAITVTARIADGGDGVGAVRLVYRQIGSDSPTEYIELIPPGTQAKAIVPTSGILDSASPNWKQIAFDDSTWRLGPLGLGYERSPGGIIDYTPLIGIDVAASMIFVNETAYLRVPFQWDGVNRPSGLRLRMRYDDGFVAYLNEAEVARANAPGVLAFNSGATATPQDSDAIVFQDFPIESFEGLVHEGTNVLAIHGLNRGVGSADFLIFPSLLVEDTSSIRAGAIPMTDTGTNGDMLAGDGIFTAVIPAAPAGTLFAFFVEAEGAATRRVWPPDAGSGGVARGCVFEVDDTPRTGTAPEYRLVLTATDLTTQKGTATNSNRLFPATFIARDGSKETVRYRAGFRYRGSSSRTSGTPGYRVQLPRDREWKGMTRMNLNGNFSYLQALGMCLFESAGVAAPKAVSVQLRINRENRTDPASDAGYGRYVHLEPLNGEFIDRHFPGDDGGNLYKKSDGSGQWLSQGAPGMPNVAGYLGNGWSKETNESARNWADLHEFMRVMNNLAPVAPPEEELAATIDIAQWHRWFAVHTIIANIETNLSTGRDGDYSMYARPTDGRFVLLPHDLDSLFGRGQGGPSSPTATIFPATAPPFGSGFQKLVRLFNPPDVRRRYFDTLRSLLDDEFSKARFDPLVRATLGGWTPATTVDAIIDFMDLRRASILKQIASSATFAISAPLSGHYHYTDGADVTVSGNTGAVLGGQVRLNGIAVPVNAQTGAWQAVLGAGGIALFPGINRVEIEVLDGNGAVADVAFYEVWVDSAPPTAVTAISGVTTLTAFGGPWLVSGNLTVPVGARLFIEPGASVYFEAGARLTVNGVLVAEGMRYARLRFTARPDAADVADLHPSLPLAPPKWGGLQFVSSMSPENVVAFADIAHAQDNNGSLGIVNSQARVENSTFGGTHLRMIYSSASNVVVRNCDFPDMFAPGEDPAVLGLDNISEQIKGVGGIPAGGHYLVEGNRFGTNKGHNDVVDVDSNVRPAPILQIVGNAFAGTGDELLDLAGDVWISGNVFTNVFKDQATSDRGYASAISTGDGAAGGTVVVARNVFYEVDHAVNLKNGDRALFENNTVIAVHSDFTDVHGNPNLGSAINLYVNEPGGTAGQGAYASGNLFLDAPRVFGNADLPGATTSALQFEGNMLTEDAASAEIGARAGITALDLGAGNVVALPRLPGRLAGDFSLPADSPARGTGPFGRDFGASAPAGIGIMGQPSGTSAAESVTLVFGGPGMFSFDYRIDGGPWSAETAIGNGFQPGGTVRTASVDFTGLVDGPHVVEARGRDFAGNLQVDPTAVSWTTDTALQLLVLSELFATGTVEAPDFVEIHNGGAATVELSGMMLSDDPGNPAKFVIPAGTQLEAGGFTAFYGLSFAREGETVALRGSGGTVVDTRAFGLQIPGHSVARRADGAWTLALPTPGLPNATVILDAPSNVRLNEWLAVPGVARPNGFLELYNISPTPVGLGGLHLSDDTYTDPLKHRIADLSFIAGRSFTVFEAKGDNTPDNASELNFTLDAGNAVLGLASATGLRLDTVANAGNSANVASGRVPDGSGEVTILPVPTYGHPNGSGAPEVVITRTTIVPEVAPWKFLTFGQPAGNWVTEAYDDTVWDEGLTLLSNEYPSGSPRLPPFGGATARPFFFRHAFDLSPPAAEATTTLRIIADDGAAVYLNGVEVYRLRLPTGTLQYSTLATVAIGGTDETTYEEISLGHVPFRPGRNLLAVGLYQVSTVNSDATLGLSLETVTETLITDPTGYGNLFRLAESLRISEILYHPAAGAADSEFIELRNSSATDTLQLGGVAFTSGIGFVFPAMDLGPREEILVVKNRAAFETVYGTGLNIAGGYTGQLSDSGEELAIFLPAPSETYLLRFSYDDAWYPETDGQGASLMLADEATPRGDFGLRASWRPGLGGGSPGGRYLLSNYDGWAAFHGLTDPAGDRNHDGISHLLDFGFGLSPDGEGSAAHFPQATQDPEGRLVLTFDLPESLPTDLRYAVETGDDFVGWDEILAREPGAPTWTGDAQIHAMPLPEGRERLTVTVSPAASILYGRLRVTRP